MMYKASLHLLHRSGFLHRSGMILIAAVAMLCGCVSPAEYNKVVKERDTQGYKITALEREVADRDAQLASMKTQVETLAKLGPERPVGSLAPDSIEIANRSGGADYDKEPGDDGITIYLRPRDSDGDAVKAVGRVVVELLDMTQPGTPRMVGMYKFEDPEELRKNWFARFATQHYALKCPFEKDAELPSSRKLLASVTFTDLLSGRTLKAQKEVTFTRRTDQ